MGNEFSQYFSSLQSGKQIDLNEEDDEEFPKQGIRLSFLLQFVEDLSSRLTEEEKKMLVTYTTTDICELYIKPITQPYQCSFCKFYEMLNPTELNGSSSAIGKAMVFISHAWKFRFIDVLAALKECFKNELNNNEDIIIWFDLVSNNQHKAPNRNFDWWSNTFLNAIKELGRTVMILSPWNDPIPLTRAWCIWELYCTIVTHCQFEIALSLTQKEEFFNFIGEHRQIEDIFGMINGEKSESFNPLDKEQIHHVILQTIGFIQLNQLIYEKLRIWITERYYEEYKEREKVLGECHPVTLSTLCNLGHL